MPKKKSEERSEQRLFVELDRVVTIVWTADLAKKLRAYREQSGLSQDKVAEATVFIGHPVLRPNIQSLESSSVGSISVKSLLVLAEVLKFDPIDLVGGIRLIEQGRGQLRVLNLQYRATR